MNPGISIRLATEGDAGAIARLSVILGYEAVESVTERRLRAILRSESDLIVVAADEKGGVAGWLQAHAAHILESGLRVEITGLVVAPEQRRKGMARALVSAAERWADSLTAKAVVVRSNVQRTESHQFYPAVGYALIKTQKVYRKSL